MKKEVWIARKCVRAGVGNDWLSTLIFTFLGAIAFIAMLNVDCQKYFGKYVTEKRND